MVSKYGIGGTLISVASGLAVAFACGPDDRAITSGTGGSSGEGGTCTPPVAGPCDNFPQCGCASGQSCDFKSSAGETECVASGPKGPYSVCNGVGQCQAGSTCLKNDPGATDGVCRPFCDTNADCVGDGRICQGGFGTVALKYCTLSCDLADPTAACGQGLSCVLIGDGAHTDCAVAGNGVGANACTSSLTACAPGHFCNNGGCVKWCRVQLGNADCGSGWQCVGFGQPVNVGGVVYGGCAPL